MEKLTDFARRFLIDRSDQWNAPGLPDTAAPGDRLIVESAPGRPVYWEAGDGAIRCGTAVLLGKNGTEALFWIGIEDNGEFRWIREDLLRSKGQFEAQRRAPTVPHLAACSCCNARRFWVSIHGRKVCGACHPPASPELVLEWITEAL